MISLGKELLKAWVEKTYLASKNRCFFFVVNSWITSLLQKFCSLHPLSPPLITAIGLFIASTGPDIILLEYWRVERGKWNKILSKRAILSYFSFKPLWNSIISTKPWLCQYRWTVLNLRCYCHSKPGSRSGSGFFGWMRIRITSIRNKVWSESIWKARSDQDPVWTSRFKISRKQKFSFIFMDQSLNKVIIFVSY